MAAALTLALTLALTVLPAPGRTAPSTAQGDDTAAASNADQRDINAHAVDAPIRIGVLAYKGPEAVQRDWSRLRQWLQTRLPGRSVELLDFDQAGLTGAVRARAVDFIISSSGHYAMLEQNDGASRIATLASPWSASPQLAIGSAIVVRRDAPLHTLAELAGKHVLAVAPEAFGGYQIAARELLAAGVDPERDLDRLQFSGFPTQQILLAVRAGRADAGIVRSCLLEQMIRSGELGAGELRVLAPLPHPGSSCQSSSRLYPDWPFAALRHTAPALSRQVAVALLTMAPTADGYSWTVPSDYGSVDELFHELRIGPYDYLRQWTIETALRRYWGLLLLALGLLVLWAVHTVRVEHLVARRSAELLAAQQRERQLADEAQSRQATLDHTARLAILGEMASAIAHELNQPLAAIGNFARGMARRIDAGRTETAPLLEGANEIAAQSERAADIMRKVRALAQKRAPERRRLDLGAVLDEAVALFRAAHPQARVNWQAGAPAPVLGDALQIQQVALNLLKNALDAQRSTHAAAEAPLLVTLRARGRDWRVCVRDRGCGLAPDEFVRLFEPFFTTKAEGLGLGLSLSKGIMESFGGTLSVRPNDDGVGLSVCFTLPNLELSETP
ncbi:PhnD/SsuA/transferrin family substrate-binding protein [Rugamonas sp. CCM 8940]|uniref:sensor histidine kinase n=1 Tax=Rugamonas sp. CCM 8940 TaxID=2765359 RepID=UPI0018F5F53E|nr:sensor histidine kinase [Rugamonas sp. CCM 8940]MBJ7310288.1 PhnD/SsuA/transferrin family substrate-binding protein [Rugamonas sp. CCM 8940]